ncbi:MAG: hypothetical protein ACOCUY_02330, partial [Verrucomicrobiota bacterium]
MLESNNEEGMAGDFEAASADLAFAPARIAWVLAVCVLWSGFVCARLAQYMVFQRAHFVALMEDEAWRVADVPALRGRILDREGTPLAWSTRHFRVVFRVPAEPAAASRRLERIRSAVPQAATVDPDSLVPGQTLVLAEDPSPNQLAAWTKLATGAEDLRVESYFQRHYYEHASPNLRQRLGTVRTINGQTYGVAGEEERHDHLLRGTAGKYRVMVGRDGEWLPGTWETLRELRPGYDVYLNVRA